jgi:hypothetical protein
VLAGRAKTEIPVYGVPAYRPEEKDALLRAAISTLVFADAREEHGSVAAEICR